MLQGIHDRLHSWFAWVIVILICACFVLWGAMGFVSGGSNGHVLAKVNHSSINQSDVNATYERLRQESKLRMGAGFEFDQTMSKQLKLYALEQLIQTQVLRQAALKAGYRVAQAQLHSIVMNSPEFQENGKFSPQRFGALLARLQYSENDFFRDISDSVLLNQVKLGLVNSAILLPYQIEHVFDLMKQEREVSVLMLARDKFKDKVEISEKMMRKFYDSEQQQFKTPHAVSIEYIELKLDDVMANVKKQLSQQPDKLKAFYDANKSNFIEPQQWQVAHIAIKIDDASSADSINKAKKTIDELSARIAKGEDFAKLAKQYSSDILSAQQGGKLEWISADSQMTDPAFKQAVMQLEQVGTVSKPVRTGYGFNIIKLLGYKPAKTIPFAKAKAQILQLLTQQQAEEEFAQQREQLSDVGFANPSSLTMPAKVVGLPVQRSGLFSKEKPPIDGVIAEKKVMQAAFSDDVLKQGNNSDVLEIRPGHIVMLRLLKNFEPQLVAYNDIKGKIREALAKRETRLAAVEKGHAIIDELKAGKAQEQVAKPLKLKWQHFDKVTHDNKKINPEIVDAIFKMQRPQKDKPSIQGVQLSDGNYMIIQLNAVRTHHHSSADDLEYNTMVAELKHDLGNLDYENYISYQVEKAKIKRMLTEETQA